MKVRRFFESLLLFLKKIAKHLNNFQGEQKGCFVMPSHPFSDVASAVKSQQDKVTEVVKDNKFFRLMVKSNWTDDWLLDDAKNRGLIAKGDVLCF